MDSRELIDAQFDRAVEIVQNLPKTGPIQTGYEEKLTMYSLYKQATAGNVKSPKPGIWDMLGRAKWEAWAKHKDLDSYEAKWLYVDALLKVSSTRSFGFRRS
jgi:acyl-CoA-binding protein